MKELRAKVTGRVQMVMFRDFATRKARGLRLVGYVKNLPDGSVEVVAQGKREVLEVFVQKLQEGSLLAKVEKVAVVWGEPSAQFSNFTLVR